MTPPDLGSSYFPLTVGSWVVYEVDSVSWNNFFTPTKIDSFSYQIKMVVDSSYLDNEGNTNYFWKKYYRDSTTAWTLQKNYSLRLSSDKAETFEENFRYIKLAFPMKNSINWDMNAYNSLDATSSYYDDYHIPLTVNDQAFDSCAIVIHQDFESLISKDYHQEIYAKHVGLIYKKKIAVEKEINGEWVNGYYFEYRYLDHGNY